MSFMKNPAAIAGTMLLIMIVTFTVVALCWWMWGLRSKENTTLRQPRHKPRGRVVKIEDLFKQSAIVAAV